VSNSTTEENLAENSVENITDQIFAEASEAFNNNESSNTDRSEVPEEEQIINAMDRDLPTTSAESSLRHRVNSKPSPEFNEEERISIKLKYINDEIKTVNGYLSETVGSFKR
jgi:hypothetical protein